MLTENVVIESSNTLIEFINQRDQAVGQEIICSINSMNLVKNALKQLYINPF